MIFLCDLLYNIIEQRKKCHELAHGFFSRRRAFARSMLLLKGLILLILFAVRDRKSCVCEYFLAQSDVDALRIWFVMVRQSPQMYAFLDDFDLVRISEFSSSMDTVKDTAIAYSGERMKALLDSREEMQKNAQRSKD